jgi:hypothetical protein
MDVLRIGRAADNNLVLDDASVSRYHARIYKRSGSWYIDDLNSSHGTTVNGKKVDEPLELKPSDIIMLSDVKLYFDGRAIITEKGKKLLLSRPAVPVAPSGFAGHNPGRVLPGRVAYITPKKSKLPSTAGLIALFLLFVVLLYAVTANKSEPQKANQGHGAYVPQVVAEYATISYDGGEYTGWLKNGIPDGQGTIKYPVSGSSGAFVNILINREKTVSMYEGEWRNGLKHGYGKMTYPNGRVELGYWENGQFVGLSGN